MRLLVTRLHKKVVRLASRLLVIAPIVGAGLSMPSRLAQAVITDVAPAGGKIQFLNRMVNFGNVTRGEELKYRFHFKNVGKGPLRVQGVHAACGCTIAEIPSQQNIAPGGGSYIDLVFKTDNFVGPVTKAITVMTTESLAPNRTLTLRANVLAEFMADPPVVDFGEVEGENAGQRTVKITPVGGFPLTINDLKYNREALEVSSLRQEGGAWHLLVRLKPMLKTGFLKESIMVASNSQTLPEFKVVVRANMLGPIRYEPAYIEFGAIARSAQAKRLIKLSAERTFQVKKSWLQLNLNGKPLANAQEFFALVPPSGDGPVKGVEVTLRNRAPHAGSVHGKLFIETSDSVQNQIVLDVYGFFL